VGQKALGGGYKRVEEIKVIMSTKITRDFLNQDGNKDSFNPKFKSWNNKNKKKNTTWVKQKHNMRDTKM
jgi:hypothetical protein